MIQTVTFKSQFGISSLNVLLNKLKTCQQRHSEQRNLQRTGKILMLSIPDEINEIASTYFADDVLVLV
jgi:hypothetical protein